MATYCRHCSIALFGEDKGNLAGIVHLVEAKRNLYGLQMCEVCGPIQVDHNGARVNPIEDIEDILPLEGKFMEVWPLYELNDPIYAESGRTVASRLKHIIHPTA